jgi:hypothetical protein
MRFAPGQASARFRTVWISEPAADPDTWTGGKQNDRGSRERSADTLLPAELPRENPAHALSGVCADEHGGGDHPGPDPRQDAPHRLHALPQLAGDLSGGLPRELRLLRACPPPRGSARLRRSQFHPCGLADCALRGGDRTRENGLRQGAVPAHVHLDDHPSELERRHLCAARKMGARGAAYSGLDPFQSDDAHEG